MTNGKTVSVIALSVVATLAITSITGFQLNEITAQETSEKKYQMDAGTEITMKVLGATLTYTGVK